MTKDMLDVADNLRSQLGIFYWTIQHGGDVQVAARQLLGCVRLTEQEASPWRLVVPQTLFARWSQLQLTLLLCEARRILQAVDGDRPIYKDSCLVPTALSDDQPEDQNAFLLGPLI